MRDLYLILNTVIAVALLVLGMVAIVNDKKSRLNRLFLLFTICVGIWMITAVVSNDTRYAYEVSLVGNYLVFAFSYFASYLLFWFAAIITSSKRTLAILKVTIVPVLLVGGMSATPLVVAGVQPVGNINTVRFGPLVALYGILLITFLAASVTLLRRGMKRPGHASRLRVIYYSLLVALPILITTQFIAPVAIGSFEVTDVGILIMCLPVYGLYVSTVRHGLFDLKLAAVRSMAYVLSLGVLAGVYYGLAYIVSTTLFKSETATAVSVSPTNIFLALILAFIFQPIKQFFDRLTDNIFYHDAYKTDDFFARVSELLGSTTDLRSLLERVSTEIASTFKAEQAYFFLYYSSNDSPRHISAGTQRHSRMPIQDARMLDAYVASHSESSLTTDTLDDQPEVRRMLVSHKIAFVMTLRYGGAPIGYLLLGERQRSGAYTKRDLKVLTTIADQLVIGIQNALSIHAVKEINATLQQRIDVATKELRSSNAQLRHLDETKDEFMSMASHQLRTPLTSVKGYISMVLEGDVGKITSQQRLLLEEAFNSSERMVRLIADFLNVSRLQTGKFIIDKTPTDIVSLVRTEVESLQLIASTHDRKLTLDSKDKELLVLCDEAKVRQVVMNFIDNAIYYTRQPHSVIKVLIAKENENAVFTVTDAGIGVPIAEQAHLFTKFFRAKNARQQRPDGTGVGLFLAKKVITAHGGKMIFSSVEGEGSTFGFYLPIGNLRTAREANYLENKHDDRT
ncbi:MAG: ATP-binding protein [Candidatus Saccharimonadales bacterium]